MKTQLGIPGVIVSEQKQHHDSRGYFQVLWQESISQNTPPDLTMCQDNLSYSEHGVLRGLHFQEPHGQGKLLTVLKGEIIDVIVDVRMGSPTFGKWEKYVLSENNGRQLYVPPGLAHGFYVSGECGLVHYKCTDEYHPECEQTLLWNDPDLEIEWPERSPVLSDKDMQGLQLKAFPEHHLPRYLV